MGSSKTPYFHNNIVTKLVKRRGEIICYPDYSACSPSSSVTPPIRSSIKEFSRKSGSRLSRYLKNCDARYRVMVTLTYPGSFPKDGKVVKQHLRRFWQRLKRFLKRGILSMCWCLEFQKRGAPHFHLLLNCYVEKSWVANTWADITGGDERACSRVEKIVSIKKMWKYMASYMAKMDQKTVPGGYKNVGRFWGVYGMRSCETLSADTKAKPDYIAYQAGVGWVIEQCIKDKGAVLGLHAFNFLDNESGWGICVSDPDGYQHLEAIWRSIQAVMSSADLVDHNQGDTDLVILRESQDTYLRTGARIQHA